MGPVEGRDVAADTWTPHVVIGWLIGRHGRKSRGGAAIYTGEGELCGISEGLWIRLRDPSTHGARV